MTNVLMLGALPSLFMLFSHIFMWGNNAHMYTIAQLVSSLCVIFIFSIIFFLMNYCIIKHMNSYLQPKSCIFLTSFYISFLFFLICLMIGYTDTPYKHLIYAFFVFLIVSAAILRKKHVIMFYFWTVMLCLSFANFSINCLKEHFFSENTIISSKTYKLVDRPNIYLYWLESYNDFDILSSVYGLDTSAFKNFLERNDFMIKKSYSSWSSTLGAFAQLYTCSLNVRKFYKNFHDGTIAIRNAIGGNENNFVMRVLKDNGYTTALITQGLYYYMLQKGSHLDEVDLNFGINYYLYPIYNINTIMDSSSFSLIDNSPAIYKGDLFHKVKTAIDRCKASEKPYFIAFKGGAAHTPLSHTFRERDAWISSGLYQRAVQESDNEAVHIINYIIEHDKNSLIILLGDHGPWSYRAFDTVKDFFSKYNVNPQDVADDLFNVIFAYRLPNGEKTDISRGRFVNNYNLFLYIFGFLSGDMSFDDAVGKAVSRYGSIMLVDGKLQLKQSKR